jgi:Tfp pilus assembly protein PilW
MKDNRGNAIVEYVLAMAISSIILLGIFDLFRAMSIEILLSFIDTVAQSWP